MAHTARQTRVGKTTGHRDSDRGVYGGGSTLPPLRNRHPTAIRSYSTSTTVCADLYLLLYRYYYYSLIIWFWAFAF